MRKYLFYGNARGIRKALASFAVAMFAALSIGFGSPATAAVSYGVVADVYTNYTSSTSVRPMDNPSVVSNYTFCKTVTLTTINFTGGSFSGCGSDNFLVRYRGYIYSPTAQTLYFRGSSDDGFWAKVGGTVVVNNWTLQGCTPSGTGSGVSFAAGEFKTLDAWFFEHGGGECSKLHYSTNASYSNEQIVPDTMLTTNNFMDATFIDTSIQRDVVLGSAVNTAVEARATGTLSYTLQSGSPPPGLSINSTTGIISGTPTVAGTYTFRVKATANDNGNISQDITPDLTMIVGSPTGLTQDLTVTSGWIGQPIGDRAIFSGYPAPNVVVGSGNLPPGVSVSSNGTLSGSPTASGNFTFTLKATNFADPTGTSTASRTIFIEPKPAFTADSGYTRTLELGDVYTSFTPTTTGRNVTFSLEPGTSLPAGLTLSAANGRISGTPTVSGSFTFKVQATNLSGTTLSRSSVITIQQAPRFTKTASPVNAAKDSLFSFDFDASGFPTPTFSVVDSTLPAGLTLNPTTGLLSGRPTENGEFEFTIRASNSGGSVDIEKSLKVTQAPTAVDSALLTRALTGANYNDGVTYQSFPAPTYRIAEGVLPPGLRLNSATGALVGSPSLGGIFNFKIGVTNGTESVTTGNFALEVSQPPTKNDDVIVGQTLIGTPYSDSVSVNAFPTAVFSLTSGSLPTGITLNPTTGELIGTPTSSGLYSFAVTARNSLGALIYPLSLVVQEAPKDLRVQVPLTANVGDSFQGTVTAGGYPAPTFRVASGALPDGVTLDPATGVITGSVTNGGKFNFTISATNEAGTQAGSSIAVEVIGVKTEIAVEAAIGEVITGKSVGIAGEGLKPNAPYEVILRSTPQTLADGNTSAKGAVTKDVKIPGGLEPGWHSITLETVNADGSNFEKAIYFQVTETLLLEEISEVEPTAAQKEEALINDPEFYERMGLDPAATVSPAAVAEQVEQVTSVVASVALVSAAAAGAAAAASAAGGAASSAGGSSSSAARASGGGTASSSSGSSGGSSGGSAGNTDSEESEGGDYGNIEAEHDDFEVESAGLVDRMAIWKLSALTLLDKPLTNWIEKSAQVSPVLSRILNDGSYLRSLLGSVMGLVYLSALALGVMAVDPGADSLASSGRVAVLVAIMAIGTLDALFGILAMSTFVITSLALMPIAGIGDIRYLLAMFILGFAPSIMATTFRKIRRPAIENIHDAWERIVDLALIGFISVLTVISLVGSVSAFAGATVPLSEDVKPIAFAITAVALIRVLVEELAAKFAPNRLNTLNPTEVPGTFAWQPWASLGLKVATLVLMIGGMVGMGWHLWVGTFLIFLPGLIGMVYPNLPSFKWIHEFIPGGVGALAFATMVSAWSGEIVNSLLGKSELYGQLSFILIPLPVILIAIIGMFAMQEEKLWQRTGKKWIYIVGSIAVFAFTVHITDFLPTILG